MLSIFSAGFGQTEARAALHVNHRRRVPNLRARAIRFPPHKDADYNLNKQLKKEYKQTNSTKVGQLNVIEAQKTEEQEE